VKISVTQLSRRSQPPYCWVRLFCSSRMPPQLRARFVSASRRGDDEDLWAVAAQQAKKHGLNVELVTFNDDSQPGEALEHADVNANSFQHKPYRRLAAVFKRITVR
jgi:ABC-type metal ion transport system substrate-binding protein